MTTLDYASGPGDEGGVLSGRAVREILRIAVPSSLSMLSFTLMQFFDGLMVARIRPGGAESLSAQFAAGFSSFIMVSFFMGLTGIVSTFAAQNLGAGRRMECGRYAWAGLYLAVAAGLLLLGAIPAAGWLFGLMGHAPAVQALEITYFRYMVAMSPLLLAAKTLENYFFGLHRAALVFVVTAASNVLNLAGNYVLIFGKLGFRPMGLEGAALSTVIANGVYLAMFATAFLSGRQAREFGARQWREASWTHVRDLLRVGWSAGLQFFLDMFSWGACMVVLTGRIDTVAGRAVEDASTIHLSATNVILRYMHISFMPAIGLGIAAAAVVGRLIGAGRRDLAASRALTAWLLGLVYMGVCGAVFFLFGEPLMDLFMDAAPSGGVAERRMIVEIGGTLFMIAAVFQIFDATGIIMSGALRGAGDTLFPMIASAVGGLGVGLGGGWLLLHVAPGLESRAVWTAGACHVSVLGLACMGRFLSGRWRRIDLVGRDDGPDARVA